MALTAAQKANLLFKALMGKGSSSDALDFFEESQNARGIILPSQVWQQASSIPNTAPGSTTGVVALYTDQVLTAIAGTSNRAYTHANLVDCIPFNYGDGTSYNYTVKDSTGAAIAFGQGDWVVDPVAGTITFYGTVPSNMPPKITFYKYVGTKGVGSAGAPTTISGTAPVAYNSGTGVISMVAATDLVDGYMTAVDHAAMVTKTGTQTVTNKSLSDSTTAIVDVTDATKKIAFDAGGTTATKTTIAAAQTADRVITLPDATTTLVGADTTQTFTNKSLSDATTAIVDSTDATKKITFDAGGTTATKTTLTAAQTADRVITLPDATTTLVGTDTTQTISNKSMVDANHAIVDSVDATKKIMFDAGGTTATKTTITASQTADRVVTLPDATTTLLGTATAQVVTNKDIDGGTASNTSRFTIPSGTLSALSALTRKQGTILYATDTLKFYADNGTTLVAVGSGVSGVNYLADDDSNAENGIVSWGTYNDASAVPIDGIGGTASSLALSVTTTAGEILNGAKSFKVVKTATNAQGQGVYVPMTIPLGYRTKKAKASFKFKIISGSIVEGDISGYIVQDWTGTPTIVAPFEVGKLVGSQGEYVCYFDPNTAYGAYKFVLHFASASTTAVTFSFDDVVINDSQVSYGMAGSDWTDYTPTISNIPGTVNKAKWRRVGDTMEVYLKFTASGAATGNILTTIPSQYTIDTNKFDSGIDNNIGTIHASTTAAYIGIIQLNTSSPTTFRFASSGSGSVWNATTPTAWANGNDFTLQATLPIVGWSSNVQMASSSTFNISSYLANGTRVTATPTALGQYRAYTRSASTVTFTDVAPAITPTASNGIALYGGEAWGTADPAGEPSKYEIFVGKNKNVVVNYYVNTGKSVSASVSHFTNGTSSYGTDDGYDPNTGVVTVQKYLSGASTAGQWLGFDAFYNALTFLYFDIVVAENALMIGNDTSAPVAWSGTSSTSFTGTETQLALTSIKDSNGMLVGGNTVVIAVAGTYSINANLYANNGATSHETYLYCYVNNVQVRLSAVTGTLLTTIALHDVLDLKAGDVIKFTAQSGLAGTYTNNGSIFSVVKMAGTIYSPTPSYIPTVQKFTASGTYTPTAGVRYAKVKMVGGGGGGGGSGTAGGGTGGAGGITSFGTILTANGGSGGGYSSVASIGGTGGTATIGAGAIGTAVQGGYGGNASAQSNSYAPSGGGGVSPFGGASGGSTNGGGTTPIANTGSGGGGASMGATAGLAGHGGGAGGYIDAIVTAPATTTVTIGAGGTGGTLGTSGNTGGAGSTGYLIVEEYYQ